MGRLSELRMKLRKRQSLRYRINHRTQQAISLQQHAETDEERAVVAAMWREIDELKRELDGVE